MCVTTCCTYPGEIGIAVSRRLVYSVKPHTYYIILFRRVMFSECVSALSVRLSVC